MFMTSASFARRTVDIDFPQGDETISAAPSAINKASDIADPRVLQFREDSDEAIQQENEYAPQKVLGLSVILVMVVALYFMRRA